MAVLTAAAAMPGAILGILESLSGVEFLVIAVFAFLVLGPEKLPDAMRKAGRALGEVRKMTAGFQEEVRSAMAQAEAAAKLPEDFTRPTDSSTATTPSTSTTPTAPAEPSPDEPDPDGAPPESDESG